MPFLIRIILQRLLVVIYSFLVFLGLAPEAIIPTEQEALTSIKEHQEKVQDFFYEEKTQEKISNLVNDIINVGEKIIKIGSNLEPQSVEIDTQSPTINLQKPESREVLPKTTTPSFSTKPSVTSDKIADVVINIVCSERNGNLINVSAGSGVIIDPKGIILTNAHVGQFVLLEDNSDNTNIDCAVYKENIPTFGYRVDVLYISPEWVSENYHLINSTTPKGTGEFDYAFLYITQNTNPTSRRPDSFPYSKIILDETNYEIGKTFTVAGYPGVPQNLIDILSAGALKKDSISIIDVFTFNKNTTDIFSTSKTFVGARGASGGGVFDKNNNLIGIISTTNGKQNNASINALTTVYINSSLKKTTGKSISTITQNPEKEVSQFNKEYGVFLANLLKSER